MSVEHDTTGNAPATASGGRRESRRGFLPEPGETIGRYLVREPIAEGGMGMIYTAEDPELGRVVAIKLLHPDLSGSTEVQEQRLQREAQAMAKVSHANLVTVFDVGTHDGQVFIAMEYVVGVTLQQWLGPKRDWRDIIDVFCAAGRGLAAAHKAGLVHRDFKPANVLVGDDGVPQVLDFGLVRRAGEADAALDEDDDEAAAREDTLAIDLTRTGSVMGTPAYMAPEQHLSEPTDARSDQFGFCVALYEALYEQRPFPGEDAGTVTMAVLENHRRPRPSQTEVPASVYKILDRGISRAPGDRYPSMEPLLEALSQEVSRARSAAPPPTPSRTPWLLAAGAAIVLAVGGVIATMSGEETPEEQPPAVDAALEQPEGPAAKKDADERAERAKRPRDERKPEKRGSGKSKPAPTIDPGTALPGVEEEPLPGVEPEPEPEPETDAAAEPQPQPDPEPEPTTPESE